MTMTPESLAVAAFGDLELPDTRLSKRYIRLVRRVAAAPNASIPAMCGHSEAEVEAAYRALGNHRVEHSALIDALARVTAEKVARSWKCQDILVLHDSSNFVFGGETKRKGLGPVTKKDEYGFIGHFALAVSGAKLPSPVGLLHFEPVFRKRLYKRKNLTARARRNRADCESKRWERGVAAVERRVEGSRIIHVADREADIYELLLRVNQGGHGFVIRELHDRKVERTEGDSERPTISERLGCTEFVAERDLRLSPRSGRKRKKGPRTLRAHPARSARDARVSIRATSISILRSHGVPAAKAASVDLTVVQVAELSPPTGEKAVEWRLLTNEPATTPEEILRVVDIYRRRWLIEEFFKVVKNGCAYEQRQLESAHSLLNMLALTIPVAASILQLRAISRDAPDTPAAECFSRTQLEVLEHFMPGRLGPSPTIAAATLAVAALGGHIKNNGPPGPQVLYRGWKLLLDRELVWLAAKAKFAPRRNYRRTKDR